MKLSKPQAIGVIAAFWGWLALLYYEPLYAIGIVLFGALIFVSAAFYVGTTSSDDDE